MLQQANVQHNYSWPQLVTFCRFQAFATVLEADSPFGKGSRQSPAFLTDFHPTQFNLAQPTAGKLDLGPLGGGNAENKCQAGAASKKTKSLGRAKAKPRRGKKQKDKTASEIWQVPQVYPPSILPNPTNPRTRNPTPDSRLNPRRRATLGPPARRTPQRNWRRELFCCTWKPSSATRASVPRFASSTDPQAEVGRNPEKIRGKFSQGKEPTPPRLGHFFQPKVGASLAKPQRAASDGTGPHGSPRASSQASAPRMSAFHGLGCPGEKRAVRSSGIETPRKFRENDSCEGPLLKKKKKAKRKAAVLRIGPSSNPHQTRQLEYNSAAPFKKGAAVSFVDEGRVQGILEKGAQMIRWNKFQV